MNGPIVILGLGRSGTTWLSDIISKYSGRIILFEPLHPMTFPSIQEHLYKESAVSQELSNHLSGVLNKELRTAWLLRNHINADLDDIDPLFLSELWQRVEVIGFKSIRLNTSFSNLLNLLNARVLYIIRHPLAVIASIRNRPNFWNDLSWKHHWSLLCNNISDQNIKQLINSCDTNIKRLAFYWAYINSVALRQLKILETDPIFYEDLYWNPFQTAEQILSGLKIFDHPIHPAHLFTPSMSSMTTAHLNHYSKFQNQENSLDFFWNNTLSTNDIKQIFSIISNLCKYNEDLDLLCSDRNYLSSI